LQINASKAITATGFTVNPNPYPAASEEVLDISTTLKLLDQAI